MKKYLILFLFWLNFSANAQISAIKKAQIKYDDGLEYVDQKIPELAINAFKEAVKADPKFLDAHLQLGDLYRKLKLFEEAKKSYITAIAINKNLNIATYYYLAYSQLSTGDYANAKNNFNYFVYKYSGTDKNTLTKAKKFILDCDFAIEAIKHPTKYEPINLGFYVNSKYRDYFPALTADGTTLIFTRNVDGNEDFYVANKENNEWQKAVPLNGQINTVNYNEGAQSISPDGKYLFFTACNCPDNFGRCDIYISKKSGNSWEKPINLGEPVNTQYWESQPAITADGNTLYFVSNRPGGFGGFDIWKCTLIDEGKWSIPENLGATINTAYDENTPFVHADGKTLYFSSDGWPGFGKQDIFYSRMDEKGIWTTPKNLGYPINTFNEEVGLIVTADGTEGLFSTNLGGGFGDMDIYSFKLPSNVKPLPITYVKGKVKDKETKEVLAAVIMAIDLKTNEAVFNNFTTKENGDFLAVLPIGNNYSLDAIAEGYLFYSENFELNETHTNKPFEIEIELQKIKLGANVVLKNIFFETNKFELISTSVTELNLLLDFISNNPNLHIEIEGHTDNVGDEKLNQKLAENRAKAVYDFLITNGIAATRLTFKGYGASKPSFNNNTAQGRAQNRRTEFIITKI